MMMPYKLQVLQALIRTLVCIVFIAEFSRCAKESGLLLPFKCRKENTAMKSCLASWLVSGAVDNGIVEECAL